MTIRLFAPTIILLIVFGTTQGDEASDTHYSQLKQLQAAMAIPSFPSPSKDVIQTWIQESDSHGVVNKHDFTKRPLNQIRELPLSKLINPVTKSYDGKIMNIDLTNVVVISNNGRLVRCANWENRHDDIAVLPGNVVAFLLSKRGK